MKTSPAQIPMSFSYGPRYVVCFSGGHSSALVAVEVVRRYGRDGVVLLNHDINPRVEDPDVKRFKREVADHLGLPITYASHARWEEWDQFDAVEHARAFKVKNGEELCTNRLKTKPFRAWLAANCPPGSATIFYGYDPNEQNRIRRRATIVAEWGYETAYPLAHWERTIQSTREVGIEPPLTYSTFKHANCVGCLKAGWQHWYVVRATRPDVWERAKLAEERIGHTIHADAALEEREDQFDEMLRAGVEPTERVPSGAFWADARRKVRSLPVLQEEVDERPCECVYRRARRRRASLRTKGRPMKPRPWTHSELVILRKLYPSAPQGRVVASLPERTWGAIRRAAVGAGIRRVAPRPHWTKAEDAALRKLYPSAPQRQVRAALPGRRWHAVQRRAAKLGVRRVAGARPWTGEDVRALREMWPEHARRTIRERLGRSWDAIAKRAFLLGLARRRDGSTPAMRWAGYISIAEAARRCGYERRSFLIALRAYQRHFKTIPQGPGRAELPSPKPIVRGKSGRCVQRVVDEQAAVDAVEWWLRQETVSAAAARLGVKHRALFAAAKRCGARLKKYARREPAWWDDVAARGARGTR